MVKARKYVVKKHFNGLPRQDDFVIVEEELPALENGEILVKTEWISVDPYLRAYNKNNQLPYDQFSYQVGSVIESKNSEYPVATTVVSHKGWCDYYVINPESAGKDLFNSFYALPDLKGLSASHGVGAVGMPGATAYFGFLEICKPQPGETVVVTGAAGAVGSLVGQIAKIKGCKVIGFAGSDNKVKWLESIGFDKAYNYKTVNVNNALNEAAPKGIDCYFDNVGGEISSAIINKMNPFGRVSVCGSISNYNNNVDNLPKASILQPAIVPKQLKIEGFVVDRWIDRWPAAFAEIVDWIQSGKLQAREHITEGFDQLCSAFVGMLNGENSGKAVVKII